MSLAPASIRGARLKARLAVKGIQNAARSFGTLTADGGGLLSSIGILMHCAGAAAARQAISFNRRRKPMAGLIAVYSAGFEVPEAHVRHVGSTCGRRGPNNRRLAACRVRWYHPAHA